MELLLQLLLNGFIMGSIYMLLAMGYGLIYGTTNEFHVAHGGVFTFSSYIGYLCYEKLGLNLWLTFIVSILFAGMLGMLIQSVIYSPMRKKGAPHLTIFIASLGVLIVLENLASILFGVSPLQFSVGTMKQPIHLGSVVITPIQLIILSVSLVFLIAITSYLRFTRVGRAIRGVSDSKEVARVVGINISRINLIVYGLGSMLAAPAGVLLAIEAGATPYRGTVLVLLAAIAMIIGGIGSVTGAALAGILLALFQNLSVWQFPSEWQNVISFGLFLLLIFLKPTGFFGSKVTSSKI